MSSITEIITINQQYHTFVGVYVLVQYSKDYSLASSRHVVKVKLCFQLKQIVKTAHEIDEFKADQQFQFEKPPSDPPSRKLVAEVEETRGNGWAATITGSLEVNPWSHTIVHV